jgi:integrase
MARTVRDSKLEKWEQRSRLVPKRRYFRDIGDGIALCYRRGGTNVTGTWAARIRDDKNGRYALRSLGAADDYLQADGKRVLTYRQACQRAVEVAERGPTPAYTVNDAIKDYLAWFRENRKSIDETEAAINAHIRPVLGDRALASLTAGDIKAWQYALARQKARKRTGLGKAQGHKSEPGEAEGREEAKRARRATANRIFNVLRAILNKAFHDERVPDDTAWRRVKPFGKVDLPRIRFLTAGEATQLVNGSSVEFRPLLRAALLTGARYGELARMNVRDFNPTTAQLYVAPSKSGKARYIPLNAAGVQLFKTLTTGRGPNLPMFVRSNGEAWGKNHQQRPLLEACKRAKIVPPLRFHEARHSYASALAQAGADLLTISKLLGHADTRITSRNYAHLGDRTLANAVNNMLPDFGSEDASNIEAIR